MERRQLSDHAVRLVVHLALVAIREVDAHGKVVELTVMFRNEIPNESVTREEILERSR